MAHRKCPDKMDLLGIRCTYIYILALDYHHIGQSKKWAFSYVVPSNFRIFCVILL